MAKFDHCDHRPNLQGNRTAHISPPDIAISLPDIYPTGNTTEPPRDTPNHIAILPPYLTDIDTNTEPMNNYHPARD